MSNLIYTDEMYNEFQKNRFLNHADVSDVTAEGYKILFKKSATLEKQFDKDLYDFNLPEIEQTLKYLGAGVATTVSNYVSVIKNYIYWAMKEDLRTTNRLNPLNDVTLDLNYYEQFVEATRDKKLFTEKTIWRDIIGKTVNAQDAVIIALYFYGVATEEILNLKKDDIFPNSDTLILRNEGESRKLVVDERVISLCNQALAQEEYEKLNGNSAAKAKVLKLVESDFVVKSVQSQTTRGEGEKADVHSIYRRLKMLSEQLEYPYLQATNIRNSGMLHMFRKLYLDNGGSVDTESYFSICQNFGLKKTRDINGTGNLQYNHYPLRSAFLNEEMMKNVYGDEDSSI